MLVLEIHLIDSLHLLPFIEYHTNDKVKILSRYLHQFVLIKLQFLQIDKGFMFPPAVPLAHLAEADLNLKIRIGKDDYIGEAR